MSKAITKHEQKLLRRIARMEMYVRARRDRLREISECIERRGDDNYEIKAEIKTLTAALEIVRHNGIDMLGGVFRHEQIEQEIETAIAEGGHDGQADGCTDGRTD